MNKQTKFVEKFNRQHGGLAKIDFKKREIELSEGALFSLIERKVKLPRVIGYKKLLDGCSKVLFSKKKYPAKSYTFGLWFEELGEIITWFKALKRELERLGHKTGEN